MARIPEIIRRGNISQVATHVPKAGDGWKAIAEIAAAGAEFVKPAAVEQAREEGLNAVYRDESGKLGVHLRSKFGGEMADVHNTAAHAKYLSQRSIDISETYTELANKYQFDPAGFKEASDLYIQSIQAEQDVPGVLREELALKAQREGLARFNGLDRARIQRDQSDTNRNTKTQRDMLADDYVNLMLGGNFEAAKEVYAELEQISQFRSDAPYISETPAETASYMRGVRGTAKAAQLTQRLEGLIGRTDLNEDERKELDDLINDPDLDPNVAAKLRIATSGRLKGIEANGLVKGLTDDSFEGRIIGAESSYNDAAKNPNSTALGPHQFLKGTWQGLIKRYKPEWAKDLSATELNALRADRDKSSEMYQHFRRENQEVLTRAGMPINPATEYMAHFFGAGGAVDVLSASPDTLVSDVVPAKVIEANPFLKNMDVRDVTNWAARKMTMKASDIAHQQVKIDKIEDVEMRALASSALADQFKVRNRFEAASKAEYDTRLAAADDTLTEQEILEDHDLSDADQSALVKKLRTARKEQIEIQQTVADLNDPNVGFDIYDTKDRNRVNKAFEASLDGASPLADQEHISSAAQLTARTGFVPKAMFNAVRSGLQSNDPETVAMSAEVANRILAESPTAFAPYGGRDFVENTLSDYKRNAEFGDATEAGQAIIDGRAEHPKNLTDEAKRVAKDLSLSDIQDHFDDWYFSDPNLGNAAEQAELMASYSTLFQQAYVETGDVDAARSRALGKIDRVYGPNSVTGSKRVMKYPPQKFYSPVAGSHDWMTSQIEKEVSEFAYGDKTQKPDWLANGLSLGKAGNWVRSEQIKMVSDAQTKQEIDRGISPSYVVYFTSKDGTLEQLPQRFFFDPTNAREALEDEFHTKRTKAIEKSKEPPVPDHF